MSQEPDADLLDVDTDEYEMPGRLRDGLAPADYGDADPDQAWEAHSEPEYSEPAGRSQPRHARPRDLRRLVMMLLGAALVVAVGLVFYLWLQVESTRASDSTSSAADLSVELTQTQQQLAETEDALRAAQVRVVDAEAQARALQEELDAAAEAAANAEDELRDSAEELRAAADELAAARGEGEALASAVLATVDPVDACVRATAQLAEDVDQVGRGRLERQAREAATTCAAAQDAMASAVSRARDLLSN